MKAISGKEFAKILEQRGWILLRINGSHHIYGKQGSVEHLSVPIHGHTPIKKGLLKHLMKLAEIEEDELS